MNEIDPMKALGPQAGIIPPSVKSASSSETKGASFEETLNGFLKDVNSMQHKASNSIQKMASGEIKDVHQVMLAAGEAKVAFNLMLEIRNKTLEAYKQVIRMRG